MQSINSFFKLFEHAFKIYELKDYFKVMFSILLKESPQDVVNELYDSVDVSDCMTLFNHKQCSTDVLKFSEEETNKFNELFTWNPIKPLLAMYVDNIKFKYPPELFVSYIITENQRLYEIGKPCEIKLEQMFEKYTEPDFYDNFGRELMEILYLAVISTELTDEDHNAILNFITQDPVLDKPQIREIVDKLVSLQPYMHYPKLDEFINCENNGDNILENIFGDTNLSLSCEIDNIDDYEDSFAKLLDQLQLVIYDI